MYHENSREYGEFINYIRYFKTRLFLPDEDIRFSKWKQKKTDDDQLNLFEKKNVA